MAGRLSIFDYQNHSQYLREAGHARAARPGRALTYSQWARSLRYRSPRGIAMVLQGKRLPSPDMLQRLSAYLGHSESEHRYLEVLVEREKQRRLGRTAQELERELWQINPKADGTHPISIDDFALIGKWYFYVVKQLVDTPSFREDYQWIQKRLRGKISVAEIRNALRVLSELGLLEREPLTRRLRTTRKSVSAPQDIASAALREHHRQVVERGLESMEEQTTATRENDSLTLRASPAALPRIKEAIRHFVNQFDKKFEDLGSEHVYQLNVQFFEHTTEVPRRKKP